MLHNILRFSISCTCLCPSWEAVQVNNGSRFWLRFWLKGTVWVQTCRGYVNCFSFYVWRSWTASKNIQNTGSTTNCVANQVIIILYKPWKLKSYEQKVRLILRSHYKHRCSTNTMRNNQLKWKKKPAFSLAACTAWPIRKLFNINILHIPKVIFIVTYR